MKRILMTVVLLVLVTGGAAVAATKITGQQVQDRTVTGTDLRDGTVGGRDVADGTLVAADFASLPPGPAGPDGPEGPQGPPGPRGPAGAPGIEYVIAERTLDSGDAQEKWTALCPARKVVIGGGASTNSPGTVDIAQSAAVSDGSGWFVHARHTGTGSVTGYAWAVCARIL